MKKNVSGFVITLIPIIFMITLILLFAGFAGWRVLFDKDASYHKTSSVSDEQKATEGRQITSSGKVTSITRSATVKDAPALYKVRNDEFKNLTVRVPTDGPLCNANSTNTKEIQVGSKVEFQGNLSNDGVITVCRPGTYFRIVQ